MGFEMNSRALILAIAAIFSLGCLGGSYSTSAGAQIIELSFDDTQIAGGETVELTLVIENVGVKTMDGNSKVWIYNVPFSDSAWSLDVINGDASNKNIISGGESIATDRFYPYDIRTNTRGAQISKSMLFTAPDVPSSMTETYDFTVRMCYPYRTTSSSIISSISQQEYKALKGIESDASTINSAGPIKIALKGDSQIRSAARIPLPFIISNVGGGYPTARVIGTDCTGEVADTPSYQRNRALVTITVDGQATDCTDKDVSLNDNGEAVVWCNYEFTGTNPKNEYHITATIIYNYFITRNARINVEGSFSAEDSFPTGGGGGGGGGGGTLVTSALLKSICNSGGQTVHDTPVPVCADAPATTTAFKYPGTEIQVLAEPLNGDISDLKSYLGSKYSTATITTFNTHSLTANDFKLGDLSLADIDSWYISSQYRKSTMTDSVYVWCEDNDCATATTYEPYVKPLGLLDALCSSCGKTTLHLVEKADILKETVTFKDHKVGGSGVLLKNMESINGMSPQDFLNKPVYGLKITSINGKSVAEMTKDSAKISTINMDGFYLGYLIDGDDVEYRYQSSYPMYGTDIELPSGSSSGEIISGKLNADFVHSVDPKHSHKSLLDHISCGGSITYSPTTHSFCITEVSMYEDQKPPFDAFSASTTAECTAKCNTAEASGGCTTAAKGDFECKGSSIIEYYLGDSFTKDYGCPASSPCLCYRIIETSLSSAEKLLLCGR